MDLIEFTKPHPISLMHASECYIEEVMPLVERCNKGEFSQDELRDQCKAICTRRGIAWNDGKGCFAHCDCGAMKRVAH